MLYFLRIAFRLGPLFIAFYAVSALLLWRIDLALMAVALTVTGSLPILGMRWLAMRGRLRAAALLGGYAVLVLASLFGFILPDLYASYLILSLVGVVCVLPYVSGRALRLYLFAVMATMVLVVMTASLSSAPAPFSEALMNGLLLVSITAPGVLICLLLWQYSTRLREQLEDIQQSEQRFRSLAEASSQAVWISRPEGNPLERSADQQWLIEKSWGSLQGSPLTWLEAIHPGDRERLLADWKQALADRASYESEFRLLLPDGSSVSMLARSVPVLDVSGQVREWISACADITERKAAEDVLRFLSKAGTQLASSLDLSTTLQSVGQLAIPRLSDWCLLDLLDETGEWQLAALMHEDARAESAARALQEEQGGASAPADLFSERLEPRTLTLSGEDTPPGMDPRRVALLRALGAVSLLLAPLVARGHPSGVLTLCRAPGSPPFTWQDILLAEVLARRVAVAIDNAQLFQQSQRAIRSRDDFLAIASHELRTPLTPLQIKLHALRRRARELARSPEAATWIEQQLAVIERQTGRLARLINEMLDISQPEGGRLRMDLEPVDLAALVREVVAHGEETGEVVRSKSQVRLRLAEEVVGQWDRLRTKQVVADLLSNALKYGQDRPIDVEVRREGALARLVVRDRGIGIAPEDQERVFGRFERAVSVRHFGGFGLGLHIARQAVEAMGGTIYLESKPGEGSVFTVLLPLAGPPEAPAPAGA
jgi:PAS domain S-box-containing protein